MAKTSNSLDSNCETRPRKNDYKEHKCEGSSSKQKDFTGEHL